MPEIECAEDKSVSDDKFYDKDEGEKEEELSEDEYEEEQKLRRQMAEAKQKRKRKRKKSNGEVGTKNGGKSVKGKRQKKR